jgi:Ca2+-binding RTX toxin-like protein
MAKPTKRWFQESGLLEDAIGDAGQLSGASLPSPSSGGVLRDLLPPLFTVKPDTVNFNTFKAGHYDPASYYAALEGSDTVVLPLNQANADAIGYDATRTFQAGLGNDTVTGGGLNDLIYGGHGNDRLYGNNGNDALLGGEGHDWLIGAKGNDLLWAGNGVDYVDAGAGNDIIIANDDDGHLLDLFEKARFPGGGEGSRDYIDAGAGDDLVLGTHEDVVYGGSGNDRIEISDCTDSFGSGNAYAGNGDDTIIGSDYGEWIFTGTGDLLWPTEFWTPENKAAFGGFNDTVISGGGNDHIMTMMYCNATVDTGSGDDTVWVVGLRDVISMGDDDDTLVLLGGACKADLGDGNDVFEFVREAHDNPNVSEVTLGAGADKVFFNTNEWLTSGDQQPLSKAPWILDFNPSTDVISQISITNVDDIAASLVPRYIYAVNITGGSALIYDHPTRDTDDFCFAKFAGVTADVLQASIELHTTFV